MRKAVIDVGSNSVLLEIEEKLAGRWKSLFHSSEVSALGEGVKATGLLSEVGMEQTLAALRRAFETAKQYEVDEIQAAATMAARIATNTDEFLDKAEAQNTPVFVLSGDLEAELGFRAIANDPKFLNFPRISIVDPGGQSTELLTADHDPSEPDGWKVRFRRSYPIGTLALRGGILSQETPDPLQILRASAEIDDLIGLNYLPHQGGHAIVLGATGTNLVTIREKMTEWDPEKVHGAYLDYEEISKAAGWLFGMTDQERSEVVGMEPGREKTLHLGALILERFLHSLHVLGCSVSTRGWRHALLEQGLPKEHNINI